MPVGFMQNKSALRRTRSELGENARRTWARVMPSVTGPRERPDRRPVAVGHWECALDDVLVLCGHIPLSTLTT